MVAPAIEVQGAMEGIHRSVRRDISQFITALDLSKPELARDALLEFVPRLVTQYGEIAGTIAADWFDALRSEESLRIPFRAKVAEVMPAEFVEQRVRYGASHLFTDTPQQIIPFLQGGISGYVTQAFGDTIIQSSEADPAGAGWARIPNPGACKFCVMLASRGFAYKSAEAASRVQGRGRETYSYVTSTGKIRERGQGVKRRGARNLGSKFHNDCRCTAAPVWNETRARVLHGYDPERLLDLYKTMST